jgi:hypothetical protein
VEPFPPYDDLAATTFAPLDTLPPPRFIRPVMIGFTGRRNVGKSTAARLLEEEFGFAKVHAVEFQKRSWELFFSLITSDARWGWRMVYGDLKDVPSEHLPNDSTPRFYMEKMGKANADLGAAWTLGLAIRAARRESARAPIVVESVVYEADFFRSLGGIVVKLERPGFESPVAAETDEAVAKIIPDHRISATTTESLTASVRTLVQQIAGGF